MGMYSIEESFGSSVELTDTLDSIMEDASLEPAEGDNFEEMAMDIVIDTNRNYNSIMESIGIMELNYLETNGKEMVYSEGTISDMVQAVKKFILKIWDKIKAFFKRFIMMFDAYFKDDKAFIDKYKKQIYDAARTTRDFEFKGYKFNTDMKGVADGIITRITTKTKDNYHGSDGNGGAKNFDNNNRSETELKQDNERLDKDNENYDDEFEKYRGDVLGEGHKGSYTDSEYRKELHEILYGGDSKEDLDGDHLSPDAAVNRLIGNKTLRKEISDMFRNNKKNIDTAIKKVETLHRTASKFGAEEGKKAANAMRNYNLNLRWMRDSCSLLATTDGIILNAFKAFSRQDKSLLVAYMRHTPKKEGAMAESTTWEHEDEMARSFLGGIKLV